MLFNNNNSVRIVSGSLNTLVILNDGSLYSAGGSEIGRAGKRSIFSRIDSVEVFQITDACIGVDFFNLCTEHKLIGFGKNDMGCLGNGTRETKEKPKLNSFFPEDVLQIQVSIVLIILSI